MFVKELEIEKSKYTCSRLYKFLIIFSSKLVMCQNMTGR